MSHSVVFGGQEDTQRIVGKLTSVNARFNWTPGLQQEHDELKAETKKTYRHRTIGPNQVNSPPLLAKNQPRPGRKVKTCKECNTESIASQQE